MALKDFLSGKEKDLGEYCWALVIEPGWVQAGIWQIVADQAEVVSISPPAAWELEEELVNAVDSTLSSAAQALPEEVKEPSKTVFGVASSWVSKGQIEDKYLEKLKRLCSDLSLDPAGFVVLPEAIAYLLKSEEGAALNAVVLGISKENIELTVFKLGKLMGTSHVARSVSVVDDVTEGLTRFAEEDPLPSRFLLYDGKEGEIQEVKRALLKANWSEFERAKFLHAPRVETVSPDRKVLAVSLAGASEITNIASVQISEEKEKVSEKAREEDLEAAAPPQKEVTPEDLGFAIGKDVAAVTARKGDSEEEEGLALSDQKTKMKEEGLAKRQEKQIGRFKRDFFSLKGQVPLAILSKIDKIKTSLLDFFGGKFMKPTLGQTFGKKSFTFGVVFLLVVFLIGFSFWWFYPKAVVTVYVTSKKLEEKVTLFVDPDISSPDFSERVLPGKVLATSVSSDKTRSATGTKTVGEKAKGEVVLYRVGSGMTLTEGTALAGPDDLRFTLDEGVTVASGSAGSPGTTKVAVAAVDIGAQYNLAAGAAFEVGNFSTNDIEAKSETAFSGGSSREISAVSSEDQKVLEQDLEEELVEKAVEELTKGLAADELFVREALSATTSAKTFSNKVGDEASNLKLSLSLDVNGLSVAKSTLVDLAKEVLKNRVPEGFVLREDQIDASFELEERRGRKFVLVTFLTANLLPGVNPEQVASKIAGKYPSLAKEFLTNIPGFSRAEIVLKPGFPGRLGTLPRIEKNIEVEVAAEK